MIMRLYFDKLIVAEFTDREVENLKGKLFTLSGLFKGKKMTDWDKFMYYCTIDEAQNRLNILFDLLSPRDIKIKDLSLELGCKPSDF